MKKFILLFLLPCSLHSMEQLPTSDNAAQELFELVPVENPADPNVCEGIKVTQAIINESPMLKQMFGNKTKERNNNQCFLVCAKDDLVALVGMIKAKQEMHEINEMALVERLAYRFKGWEQATAIFELANFLGIEYILNTISYACSQNESFIKALIQNESFDEGSMGQMMSRRIYNMACLRQASPISDVNNSEWTIDELAEWEDRKNATNLSLEVISLLKAGKVAEAKNFKRFKSVLFLDGARLGTIPSTINMLNLVQLMLSDNNLETAPAEIGSIRTLQVLKLNDNSLQDLPIEFWALTSLKKLSLDGNSFACVSDSIGKLTLLESLSLARNRLRQLTPEVNQLTNLQELIISNNKLSRLPHVSDLTLLTRIVASNNAIQNLLPMLCTLPSLEILEAQSIGFWLSQVPEEIGNLTKLETCNLANNRISYIPQSISKLQKLERLWLEGNTIEGLSDAIQYLTSLKELNIVPNDLTEELKRNIKKWFPKAELHLASRPYNFMASFGGPDDQC